MKKIVAKISAAASIGACLMLCASLAQAQYKWVGADGKVAYSDLPPPEGVKVLSAPRGSALLAANVEAAGGLPYALKTSVAKFPVVLYTTNNCAPCGQARELLTKRGIPFSEKLVATGNDAEEFKKLKFEDSVMPALMVGKEKSLGFEAGAYDRLLDAAGYPRSSLLPAGYKNAAAESLSKAGASKVRIETANGKQDGKSDDEAKIDAQKAAALARNEAAKKNAAQQAQQQLAKQDNPNNLRF